MRSISACLCGSRLPSLSTCTLAGSRATAWVGGHGPLEQGMENTCLLVCLRGRFSEPSHSQARVGRAHASALDRLQGSAPHLNSHQAPPSALGLAGLLVMVAKCSSLNTRILPQRRFPGVNAVDSVYTSKERACPAKGKPFTWDAQRIDPARKACPQASPLHDCLSDSHATCGEAFYLHFTVEETEVSERWREGFGCSSVWFQSLDTSSLIPLLPAHLAMETPPHPQTVALYPSPCPWVMVLAPRSVSNFSTLTGL